MTATELKLKTKSMKTLIEKNGYYVDENNNKWSPFLETVESAQEKSESLQNCFDSLNCSDCSNCLNCSDCSNCSHCLNCSDCSDCLNCLNCSDCSDCSYCLNCSDCSYCSDCLNSLNCSDFKENVQRIMSSKKQSKL